MKYIITSIIIAILLILGGLDFIYKGKAYNLLFGSKATNIDNISESNISK